MTVLSTIVDTTYFPARCTLNIGGGSYRYRLSCGHVEWRWASRRIKGTVARCTTCKEKRK